jgi:phytoene synthase
MSDADAYCAEQVRRFDHDRWLTTLFAPSDRRRDLVVLYAFNLELARAREQVREAQMGLIRLQWWREALDDLARGAIRRHPVLTAIAAMRAAVRLSADRVAPLIEARERDFDDAPFADLAALEAYAEGSAATLQALALEILGIADAESGVAARHVAIGWALTGLLRAAPHLARRRRCILPADRVAAQGLDIEAWLAGKGDATAAPIVAALHETARRHLDAARRLRTDPDAFAALALARLADAHLLRIARAHFRLFDSRLQRPLGSAPLRLAIARALRRF